MDPQFCSRCGRPVQTGSRFCAGCGTIVSGDSTDPAPTSPSDATSPRYWMWAIGAVAVIACAAIGFFVVSGDDGESPGPSAAEQAASTTATPSGGAATAASDPSAGDETPALTPDRIAYLESALVSGDPLQLAEATGVQDQELLADMASEGLPSGSQLDLDELSFTPTSTLEATIEATVNGPQPGTFILHLRSDPETREWIVTGTSEPLQ